MRRIETLKRRVDRVAGRHGAVPMLALVDLHLWPEEDVAAYLAADTEGQDALLADHQDGVLPEPHGRRPSVLIIVPGIEGDVVDDDDDVTARKARDDLVTRRDARFAEAARRQRHEERLKLPWWQRDNEPDGDEAEVLYVDGSYPITRREHWERMRRLGG